VSGLAWLALLATIALVILNIVGVSWVSWWAVPYPILLYMTYVALLFLFGTKLMSVALSNYKAGKEKGSKE